MNTKSQNTNLDILVDGRVVFTSDKAATCNAKRAKTQGQIAYEADVAMRPTYHDGAPRKSWSQLGEVEQWSWNSKQTPRFTDAPASYPNHRRCTECETLVHKTNLGKHNCWESRLSQQFPKSPTLHLRH